MLADDELEAALREARTAWPHLTVDPEAFASALAHHVRDASDPAAALRELAVADLYLAQACATGARDALAAFAERCDATIAACLRDFGLATHAVEELVQEVRTKLFVAIDGPPKIATYSGRAALTSWVKTVATRTALDRVRKKDTTLHDDEVLAHVPDAADSPELAHFRDRYRVEFKEAFEAALASLDVRERNVMRQYFVDRLTLDEIGALYGVHKTTVSRWLDTARLALAKRTRAQFRQRVDAAVADLDSIMRLLQSQIDLSLSRVL